MARKYRKLSPADRGSDGPSRKMKLTVTVTRKASTAGQYSRPYAFEACIRGAGMRGGGGCGYGRNPRKAVANAMRESAKSMSKRKGSFRGYRRRK